MRQVFFLSLLSLILLSIISCEEKRPQDKTTSTSTTGNIASDKLLAKFKQFQDSTSKFWNILAGSENTKFSDMKRLVTEITYCKKFNAALADSLLMILDEYKKLSPTPYSLNNNTIDQYDEYSEKVLSRMKKLYLTTSEISSHVGTEKWYNDIDSLDRLAVQFRPQYDRWADSCNTFYNKYRQDLISIADSFKNYKPYTFFSISKNGAPL